MLEIVEIVAEKAALLPQGVLVAGGLACLVAGLFIWLGGLGWRRVLALVVGAAAAAAGGAVIAGPRLLPVLAAAAVGAVLAVCLEKAFITLVAAALAVLTTIVVAAWIYDVDLSQGIHKACMSMPRILPVAIAAAAALTVVLGFYLWDLLSAVACATLGALLVFAGMIALLLFKGAEPVAKIRLQPGFYGGVFAAMVVFGTFEQLLLCRHRSKKTPKEPPKTSGRADHDQSSSERTSWRTS